SFDHLVGAGEQCRWYLKAERPRRSEIDYQLKFCGLHDRKIGWLCTPQNSRSVNTELAACIRKARPVTDQATGPDKLAPLVNHWNAGAHRQRRQLLAPIGENAIRSNDKGVGLLRDERCEHAVKFDSCACAQDD